MIYIVANIVPILLATLVGLAFGWLYYARFRPGEDDRPTRYSPAFVIAAFVAEFWLTAILAGALILAPAKADAWVMAIGSAVIIWVGFVVPALIVTLGIHRIKARIIAVDCGYWLGMMLLATVVMKAVGLVAPVA